MREADITLSNRWTRQWLELHIHQENQLLGVGPGNTPAIIDETAHIKMAVSSILFQKLLIMVLFVLLSNQ